MTQNAGVVAGGRLTDWISLGVLASSVPRDAVDAVVNVTGRQAKRSDGRLPPHVMVYVRHEALRCIPDSVGRNLEGCSWV